ncbi:MAG: hypothetical protein JSR72_23430 [Proteobacteria bacterium]|nr:hypothetical protein [Pseudomonadota bacterium]
MSEQASPAPSGRWVGVDRRLLLLNAGLLAVLAAVTWTSAQPAPAPAAVRPPGQYTLVSGRVQGGMSHVVYVLDAGNRELVAINWDRNRNQFEPLGYRSFAADSVYFRTPR